MSPLNRAKEELVNPWQLQAGGQEIWNWFQQILMCWYTIWHCDPWTFCENNGVSLGWRIYSNMTSWHHSYWCCNCNLSKGSWECTWFMQKTITELFICGHHDRGCLPVTTVTTCNLHHLECMLSQGKHTWMDTCKQGLLNSAPAHEQAMWVHLQLLFLSAKSVFSLYLLYLDIPLFSLHFSYHRYLSTLCPSHLTIYV